MSVQELTARPHREMVQARAALAERSNLQGRMNVCWSRWADGYDVH